MTSILINRADVKRELIPAQATKSGCENGTNKTVLFVPNVTVRVESQVVHNEAEAHEFLCSRARDGILALERLSAHPFKLFFYLCCRANMDTGRLEVRYGDLARKLGRSVRSLQADFSELRSKQVCRMNTAVNQHSQVQIEICDLYWDYEKSEDSLSRQPQVEAGQEMISIAKTDGKARELDSESKQALDELLEFGIAPSTARKFVHERNAWEIMDLIEYTSHLASQTGSKIRHPQSLLIYFLKECVPVPQNFITSRKRKIADEAEQRRRKEEERAWILEREYDDWCREMTEAEIQRRYPGISLERKLAEITTLQLKVYPRFAQIPVQCRPAIIEQLLFKEVGSNLQLPPFEQWLRDKVNRSDPGEVAAKAD